VGLLGRILEITFLQTYLSFFGLRNIEPVALLQISVTVLPLQQTVFNIPYQNSKLTLTLKLDTGNRQV
jgi:hypothetical protein